jgi:hypothetical protein
LTVVSSTPVELKAGAKNNIVIMRSFRYALMAITPVVSPLADDNMELRRILRFALSSVTSLP